MNEYMNREGMRVVVGLGKTGLSCIRFLKQRGYTVHATDSREMPPCIDEVRQAWPDVNLSVGAFDEKMLLSATEIILSPGVSLREPSIAKAVEAGISVIGDIELLARVRKSPCVAITGSNAKSTVTTLVGLMAKRAGREVVVAGNIGRPVLDTLASTDEPDLYVLELSSFQLETTRNLNADVATVLNVSPDHMDRYESFASYTKAKQRIYAGCRHAVINRDERAAEMCASHEVEASSFGLSIPCLKGFGIVDVDGEPWLAYEAETLIAVGELNIRGAHNVSNVLAALALGQAIGLPMESMLKTVRAFTGLPHRCQWVERIQGVDWFNDSKGTNVGATLAAVQGLSQGLKGQLVLIMGGVGKDADFSSLKAPMARHVRAVVVFGQDADQIKDVVAGAVTCQNASSLEDAVGQADRLALRGDIVLFSPACASFDMFENFEVRGTRFVNEVRKLALQKRTGAPLPIPLRGMLHKQPGDGSFPDSKTGAN